MGGLETAQHIRARKRSRHTPIIFLSAYESIPVEVSKAFVIGGVVDYLFSPVNTETLRNKVLFLTDLYLRSLEIQSELTDLRARNELLEARILELQQQVHRMPLDRERPRC